MLTNGCAIVILFYCIVMIQLSVLGYYTVTFHYAKCQYEGIIVTWCLKYVI